MTKLVNNGPQLLQELFSYYLSNSLEVSKSEILATSDSQLSVGPFSARLESTQDSNKYEITLKNKDSGSAILETIPFDPKIVTYPFQVDEGDPITLQFQHMFETKFNDFLKRFKQNEATTSSKSVLQDSTYLAQPNVSETHSLPKVDLFPKDGNPIPAKSKPLPDNLKPPGFDDEYEIKYHQESNPLRNNTETNANRDLYPGGVSTLINPLNPTVSASNNGGIVGGMYPTINDPVFKRFQDDDLNSNGSRLPGGGGRFPGSRYDDPLAGPDNDLDLAGMGLPSHMGFSGGKNNQGGLGGRFGGRGGPSGGFSGFGGPSGGYGGGYI